tara:strand:+ start:2041 stop:2298 length:258 start_codon:yes stop_codon:yes gene_type:complete
MKVIEVPRETVEVNGREENKHVLIVNDKVALVGSKEQCDNHVTNETNFENLKNEFVSATSEKYPIWTYYPFTVWLMEKVIALQRR